MVSAETKILNHSGLHARPASILTKLASQYKSEITITCQGAAIPAKRIMSVLTAGIKYGASVTITCEGEDEEEALDALLKGIESGLGEVIEK